MTFQLMTRRYSISFGKAVLLVVSFPVRPLTFLATVDYCTTSNACRKLGNTFTALGREAVVALPSVGSSAFLAFVLGH